MLSEKSHIHFFWLGFDIPNCSYRHSFIKKPQGASVQIQIWLPGLRFDTALCILSRCGVLESECRAFIWTTYELNASYRSTALKISS
jgi:hypothetical protein